MGRLDPASLGFLPRRATKGLRAQCLLSMSHARTNLQLRNIFPHGHMRGGTHTARRKRRRGRRLLQTQAPSCADRHRNCPP